MTVTTMYGHPRAVTASAAAPAKLVAVECPWLLSSGRRPSRAPHDRPSLNSLGWSGL